MSDPMPGLPDRAAVPAFSAREQGYVEAQAVARRRRRRQLGYAGGGATMLSAVLIGALLLPGQGGLQVLGPASNPAPTGTGEPSSGPGSSDVSPTPTTSTAPGPIPTFGLLPHPASPRPEPSETAQPDPNASPDPDASPGGTADEQPLAGPEPTLTTYDPSRPCASFTDRTDTAGYCIYYDGQLKAAAGSVAHLAAAICRLPGQGPGSLRSANGQYAEFRISVNGEDYVWSWGKGRRFARESRTFTLAEGRCLRFAVTWDLTGDDGRALPAGDYWLDARPLVYPGEVRSRVDIAERFTIT
ncbi:MAG TPA: BsuPI-related putative proteinase inhibitor [Mycobacteriales bacterium]|nr:BsuPI-related putative proteinase inhibitor [Mycobacteriales bacterium]